MQVIDKIISNFTNNKSLYIGEKVTMSEHMIQTAMLAEKAKCDDNLICSSLLHDYGHFILAKRYLANDKKYFNLLSEASKTSLELQGGVLSRDECAKFEAQEYFKPSILLRKFDEAAKKTDIKMKSIHDYQKLLSSKLI